MGVKGLQSFIRKYSHHHTIQELLTPSNQRLRIGIDISFYIYKWQGDTEKILGFIKNLQANQHHILLVFDGRAEDGKQWEAQRRRDVREQEMKSAQAIMNLLETEELTDDQRFMLERRAAEHQKKGWSLTRDIRHAIKERFYAERIPMVKAKGEADGLLATASSRGELDIVISGDMDLIAMGTSHLWTPIEDGLQFREYVRDEILQILNLTDWQFRSMCAICFTEASQEQNNYDIQQAYQMLKVFKSLDVLRKKYPNYLQAWPEEATHMFYRPVDKVEPWIREDQLHIYKAFINYEPMPYE
jgi:hypothetical protein